MDDDTYDSLEKISEEGDIKLTDYSFEFEYTDDCCSVDYRLYKTKTDSTSTDDVLHNGFHDNISQNISQYDEIVSGDIYDEIMEKAVDDFDSLEENDGWLVEETEYTIIGGFEMQ